MKTAILISVFCLAIGCRVAFSQNKYNSDTTQASATKADHKKDSVSYVCPMHSDVTSDKPGKCSKCGMTLEKKKMKPSAKKEKKKEDMKAYTCSMHPEVKSDKPGKCSKCSMDLVEKK